MGFAKNKIIFSVSLIFLCNNIQSQQALLPSDRFFNFDISKKPQQDTLLDSDYYTEIDSFYEALCDRSAITPAPFYKRIAMRLYIFWCTHSLRMKCFAKKRYRLLKRDAIIFFTTVSKRIKNLRNTIL